MDGINVSTIMKMRDKEYKNSLKSIELTDELCKKIENACKTSCSDLLMYFRMKSGVTIPVQTSNGHYLTSKDIKEIKDIFVSNYKEKCNECPELIGVFIGNCEFIDIDEEENEICQKKK